MQRLVKASLRFLIVLAGLLTATADLPAQSDSRVVLVTGASSGIGRKIAETLAARGHTVYAGARKQEDLDALNRIPNIKAVRLDVTVDRDIEAAVATIAKAGKGLHGVVNNAGVGIVGPLIEESEEDMRFLFDVNVYGPWKIVKAFAPLLIESKGRVVNISSISGVLSGPMLGAYSMSKHALEAFGDALAAEMARFDVRVSSVEPGNYKSDIGENVLARMGDPAKLAATSRWPEAYQNLQRSMSSYDQYPEPDDVAEATAHALFDPKPQARYMVVPMPGQAAATIRKAVRELVELNQGHKFSVSRDSLVALLDAELARLK